MIAELKWKPAWIPDCCVRSYEIPLSMLPFRHLYVESELRRHILRGVQGCLGSQLTPFRTWTRLLRASIQPPPAGRAAASCARETCAF